MRKASLAAPAAVAAVALLATAGTPALAETKPTLPEVVEGASAGPADARGQVARADAAFYGRDGVKQDYKDARAWYEKAAAQGDTEAQRKLGDMYAKGLGGKKSTKKALDSWIAAEKAGDPLAPVLVADLYYEEITGQKDPKPGQFKFMGGVPESRIDDAIAWYGAAQDRDPRPEVQSRAKMALYVLNTLKSANVQVSSQEQGKAKK
jgi:TPR repeat protein